MKSNDKNSKILKRGIEFIYSLRNYLIQGFLQSLFNFSDYKYDRRKIKENKMNE